MIHQRKSCQRNIFINRFSNNLFNNVLDTLYQSLSFQLLDGNNYHHDVIYSGQYCNFGSFHFMFFSISNTILQFKTACMTYSLVYSQTVAGDGVTLNIDMYTTLVNSVFTSQLEKYPLPIDDVTNYRRYGEKIPLQFLQ